MFLNIFSFIFSRSKKQQQHSDAYVRIFQIFCTLRAFSGIHRDSIYEHGMHGSTCIHFVWLPQTRARARAHPRCYVNQQIPDTRIQSVSFLFRFNRMKRKLEKWHNHWTGSQVGHYHEVHWHRTQCPLVHPPLLFTFSPMFFRPQPETLDSNMWKSAYNEIRHFLREDKFPRGAQKFQREKFPREIRCNYSKRDEEEKKEGEGRDVQRKSRNRRRFEYKDE